MKILVLIAICLTGVYSQHQVIEMIGERHGMATLECSQSPGRCHLFTKSQLLVDRLGQTDPRFRIRDERSCIFEISNLQLNDTATYLCTNHGEIKEFRLVVTVMPEEPKLISNGYELLNNSKQIIHPNINNVMQFECLSNQGYPNATINWYVDREFMGHANVDYSSVNDLNNVRSIISVDFVNEIEIRCEVEHLTYKGIPRVIMGHFGRHYPTNYVRLCDTEGRTRFSLVSQEAVEIVCTANGLPTPTNSDFVIKRLNDETGEYEEIAREAVYNVTKPGVYVCEARNMESNAYVRSSELTVLDTSLTCDQITFSCPPRFIRLHHGCYFFSPKSGAFFEALNYCKNFSSDLVSIETHQESMAINKHIQETHAHVAYWTSGYDIYNGGNFVWMSHPMGFQYSNWCAEEPDNIGKENCVQIYHGSGKTCWTNNVCSNKNVRMSQKQRVPVRFLCEHSPIF